MTSSLQLAEERYLRHTILLFFLLFNFGAIGRKFIARKKDSRLGVLQQKHTL